MSSKLNGRYLRAVKAKGAVVVAEKSLSEVAVHRKIGGEVPKRCGVYGQCSWQNSSPMFSVWITVNRVSHRCWLCLAFLLVKEPTGIFPDMQPCNRPYIF
jgi:hypothetical protein